MTTGAVWGVAREILTILVLPLIGWGVSLEVRAAVHTERVATISKDLSKIDAVEETVKNNSLQLVRLEGKIDAANIRLAEIKDLLNSSSR